jgi:hypothetical protein
MMRHFSRKYGIGTHTITRRIKEYDTVWVDGAAKPRLIDNDRNRQLAMKHKQIRRARPIKPLLTIDEFCAKYQIDKSRLLKRWKCIQKFEQDGVWFISDIRNNLRHCGLL